MWLDDEIEVLRPDMRRGCFRFVLFDFDGTLSLIREGWPQVMIPMMTSVLRETGTTETDTELTGAVEDFVMRLNGRQTIYQMIQLADEVRARKGTPLDPLVYKHRYHDLLMQRISGRLESLSNGSAKPEDWTVPGSHALLDALKRRGLTLFLASGTDEKFVKQEAELLDVSRYFGEHISGLDDHGKFSRKWSSSILKRIVAGEVAGIGDGFVEIEEIRVAAWPWPWPARGQSSGRAPGSEIAWSMPAGHRDSRYRQADRLLAYLFDESCPRGLFPASSTIWPPKEQRVWNAHHARRGFWNRLRPHLRSRLPWSGPFPRPLSRSRRTFDQPSIEPARCLSSMPVRSYAGARTVISNSRRLGVGSIIPVAIVGDDGEGYELDQALARLGVVETQLIVHDQSRRTPTYTKPMLQETGRPARELNRIDIKNRTPTPPALEAEISRAIESVQAEANAILILDQVSEEDCGVITARIRDELSSLGARRPELLMLADSRERLGQFRNIGLKPNEAEARSACPDVPNGAGIKEVLRSLALRTGRPIFCTRGANGITIAERAGQHGIHIQDVAGYPVSGPIDIVGAGDSTTAAIACALACWADKAQAAAFGNLIASITIQQLGTTGTASPEQVRARWLEVKR